MREQVRIRRTLAAEEAARIRSVTGGFVWLADSEARDSVGAKAAGDR